MRLPAPARAGQEAVPPPGSAPPEPSGASVQIPLVLECDLQPRLRTEWLAARGLRGAVTVDPILLRWSRSIHRKDPAPRERTASRERGYRQSVKAAQDRHHRRHGFLGELEPLRIESFEDREARLHTQSLATLRNVRQHEAARWRRARARFRELPRELQRSLAERWNHSGVPSDAAYLLTFLDAHAPTPERIAEKRAARENSMRIHREVCTRTGTPWIEHAGCGGILQDWIGASRSWTCLGCERHFTLAAARAAAAAGELTLVDPRTAVQAELSLGAATRRRASPGHPRKEEG